jgi:pimeloyl-ACP methyl ester carboxylesterase
MMKKIFRNILIVVAGLLLLIFVGFYKADIPVELLKSKYAVTPSKFDSIRGMNVHFRDEGPASDSIPLVLLHGTSSSIFTWDACTKEWIKEHRVIRMDLPGFALTGPDPNNNYSIEGYVAFVHEFLKRRNVNQCYLAGNSLGGQIAYAYAAYYPNEVKKLILIDPAGYPSANVKGSLAFKLGKLPVLKNLLTIVTPTSIVRKSIEDVYGNKVLVTDSLVQLYEDMACREGNRKALIKRLGLEKNDTNLVKRVKAPAMIIWGDQDFLIPLENAYKFQRDLANDTLVVMKGIGHVPMEESPDKVVAAVNAFINTIPATPIEQGRIIAMQTKLALGKNLMNAINMSGTVGALEFCSEKAFLLTDSMSKLLNVRIRRVSDKNRSPLNAAEGNELGYIRDAKASIVKGEPVKPKMLEQEGKRVGYYPIITEAMCLQCHGKPGSDLSETTIAKLRQLYPNDKATGYGINELRGIWVVEMYKK